MILAEREALYILVSSRVLSIQNTTYKVVLASAKVAYWLPKSEGSSVTVRDTHNILGVRWYNSFEIIIYNMKKLSFIWTEMFNLM